jgi:trigger factor
LKIESQVLEDHQVKLKVEIEPEPLESAKRRAAREIAKKAKIPGFRPGKAPYNIVERYAGPKAILADAMDLLVQDLYPKIIEEAGIKPYGPGRLENIVSTEPPVFEFVVPLEAEVTLGDYNAIRFPYEPKEITDKDVDNVLENMRQQQAVIEPVERPAQEGDLVTVKLKAERKQVEEGETPILIRERSIPIIVQPERTEPAEKDENAQEPLPEWPFPGFSRNLIGLSVNDERTLLYTYPEDSSFEMLRGKEAEYHFVVETVKSRTLPEFNDEFAQSQGEYENLEALRKDVRSRLGEEAQQAYDDEYGNKIIDELVNSATIKYPPQMLEEETRQLLRNLENRLAQQGLDMETYLKTRSTDLEGLTKEYSPMAEQRLKRFLVLYEVASKENIQVPEQEITSEATQMINQLSQSLSPEQARKAITPEFFSSLTGNVTADLLIRHTIERLRVIAKGEAESLETAPEAEITSVSGETAPAEGTEPTMEQLSPEELQPSAVQPEEGSDEVANAASEVKQEETPASEEAGPQTSEYNV